MNDNIDLLVLWAGHRSSMKEQRLSIDESTDDIASWAPLVSKHRPYYFFLNLFDQPPHGWKLVVLLPKLS